TTVPRRFSPRAGVASVRFPTTLPSLLSGTTVMPPGHWRWYCSRVKNPERLPQRMLRLSETPVERWFLDSVSDRFFDRKFADQKIDRKFEDRKNVPEN